MRLSLSPAEFAALSAFPEDAPDVSIIDLAVDAHLTGSQVRDVIDRLTERGLMERVSDRSVKLSERGKVVERSLGHIVVILEDDDARVELDAPDLDEALEQELANLA